MDHLRSSKQPVLNYSSARKRRKGTRLSRRAKRQHLKVEVIQVYKLVIVEQNTTCRIKHSQSMMNASFISERGERCSVAD